MIGVLSSPWGSVAVAALLTVIICAESRWLPWSPYFLAYAVLAAAIPLAAGGWSWGNLPELWREHSGILVTAASAMLVWELGIATWLYEKFWLRLRGHAGDPRHCPSHALEHLTEEAGRRARLGPKTSEAIFGAYTLLWAPVAEELFYWGYLYVNLRAGWPFWAAALTTSAFFGIRHATHFLYLRGRFPWPAASWLVVSTGVTAFINSQLFERIGALLPLVLIHLAANILFAAYAASLRRSLSARP